MIRFRGKTKPLRKRLLRRGFCILNTVGVLDKTIAPFAGVYFQNSCSGPAYVFAFFAVLYAKRTCDPARRELFSEFPLAAAYVFLFFAVSYAGKTPAPARRELFFRVPARGGICFSLFRHFICRKDSCPGPAGTFLPSSRSRRHMFSSFSPFHMPKRLVSRSCRNFLTELLPWVGICFSLFRRFICLKDSCPGPAGAFLRSSCSGPAYVSLFFAISYAGRHLCPAVV